MTTLAQRVAETPPETSIFTHGVEFCYRRMETPQEYYVDKQVQAVWELLHGLLGVGDQKYIDGNVVAERFVFEQNIYTLVNATEQQLPNRDVIFELGDLPCNPIWIEWKDGDGMREGVMIFEVDNYAYHVPVMQFKHMPKYGVPIALLRTPRFPLGKKLVTTEFLWTIKDHNGQAPPTELLSSDVERFFGIIMFALFLLVVPRVSEPIAVEFGEKIQRKRRKSGKLPLLEFKKVKLHISQPQKRYIYTGNETPEEREAIRRRLHQVIGHFRVYQKGREKPKVTWIPPHWRGDPELGMVLHERKVEQ